MIFRHLLLDIRGDVRIPIMKAVLEDIYLNKLKVRLQIQFPHCFNCAVGIWGLQNENRFECSSEGSIVESSIHEATLQTERNSFWIVLNSFHCQTSYCSWRPKYFNHCSGEGNRTQSCHRYDVAC